MPLILFCILATGIIASGWLFSRFYIKHIQEYNAPEQTAHVVVIDKQVFYPSVHDVGLEEQQYWIYVQKGLIGPRREFQIGAHYFHAINPGDRGVLTYQGDKFLHFTTKH
ncbi:DUF2500 domain-containing protein [Vibrio pectenicida]|uniref:DUF2500 domain-containing protein n=1 Tax=Vibrio pectenicida TaxID=62763 RepID=A0A3R9L0R4_9VIBR|nr:DUF2500 domain-containing protein [Vibrio pectenicida]RSD30363.1 DUF2500 domain-containing protein [Vibrio pectenicida]